MVKFVAFFSTVCLVCLLILMGVLWYVPSILQHTFDSSSVIREVHKLNELVTVKYSIEKVIGMREEKSPLGVESILLLVRGQVLAGVDLAELKPGDVAVSGNVVRIQLTASHIQEAYLDEKQTKVWDRSITWWTPWVTPDPDLEHKARLQAVEDIKKEALAMGILAEAQRNAESDIRTVLEGSGIRGVVFAYVGQD